MPSDGDLIGSLNTTAYRKEHPPNQMCANDASENYYFLTRGTDDSVDLYKAVGSGGSFSKIKDVGTGYTTDNIMCGRLKLDDSDNIHIAWCDSSSDLRYSKSTDAGSTWTVDGELVAEGTFQAVTGIGIGSSGEVYLFYGDTLGVNPGVTGCYKRSSGGSWSSLTGSMPSITRMQGASANQKSDGGLFYITGCNSTTTTGAGTIDYFYLNPSDDSFSSQTTGPSGTPWNECHGIFDPDGGYMHIAWSDHLASAQNEVNYGNNVGGTWSSQILYTNANAEHMAQHLSIDTNGNIYVQTGTWNSTEEWGYYKSTDAKNTAGSSASFDSIVTLKSAAATNRSTVAEEFCTLSTGFWAMCHASGSAYFYRSGDWVFSGAAVSGSPWHYYAQQ